MSNKGFAENNNIQTPNDINESEKPLKNGTLSGRVDINILKAKLQKIESKEFKRNILTLTILVFVLAVLGIYLSL